MKLGVASKLETAWSEVLVSDPDYDQLVFDVTAGIVLKVSVLGSIGGLINRRNNDE